MQLLVTSDQMRRFDRIAIERLRIPGLILMENAGRGVVERIENHTGTLAAKKILVVCGKGNNGGDGFVIARHLLNRGAVVRVALLSARRAITGDARTNLDALLALVRAKHPSLVLTNVRSTRDLRTAANADIIVDAIFGTGFSGEVRSPYRRVIEWINARKAFVVAVDIASGVDSGTGTVGNVAVRADLTVTMALGKIGQYVGEGREMSGSVEVVDIGIPGFLFASAGRMVRRVESGDVGVLLPARPLRAHKYSVGKVFLVAGSRSFTGAAAMAAQAAMRSGAGAVILGVPASILQVLARKLTEVILVPLPETEEGSLSMAALEVIRERAAWADAVGVGPGLSLHPETAKLVRTLLPMIQRPLVLDADGLTAAGENPRCIVTRRMPTVLTPHAGELSRLVHKQSQEIETFRVAAAADAARSLRSVVLLKGAPTVTASPDGALYINTTGNPGMATIGSGDVLTGLITGFLAQGLDPVQAAWAGACVHGMAGDRAAAALGERSVMAMDIAEALPAALRACNP